MMSWISVEDKLPNGDGEWVLIYADGAINCMGYDKERGFTDWTFNNSGCHNIVIENITHWMPLPKNP